LRAHDTTARVRNPPFKEDNLISPQQHYFLPEEAWKANGIIHSIPLIHGAEHNNPEGSQCAMYLPRIITLRSQGAVFRARSLR